jgi:hypothetical protein
VNQNIAACFLAGDAFDRQQHILPVMPLQHGQVITLLKAVLQFLEDGFGGVKDAAAKDIGLSAAANLHIFDIKQPVQLIPEQADVGLEGINWGVTEKVHKGCRVGCVMKPEQSIPDAAATNY